MSVVNLHGFRRGHPSIAVPNPLPESATSEWASRIGSLMAEGVPGIAAAVHHRGRILWARGFGFADVETRRPVGPGTVVRLDAITTLFTAAAVMVLRDEGALGLDDPVTLHVPEFPRTEVTIRHLLCHGSGLQREASLPPNVLPQGEALRAVLPEVQFPYWPLERWKYSNLGYCVLGEAVERVSRELLTEFVRSRVVEPLGMDDVTFDPDTLPRPRLARGYRRAPDRDSVVRDPRAWEPRPDASGQLFGTVLDLCRVGAFLAGSEVEAVLRRESLEEMRRPALMVDEGWSRGQGLGPMLVRAGSEMLVGHVAAEPAFSGWMLVSPGSGVGAAVMANAGQTEASVLPLVVSMIEGAAACLPVEPSVPWPPPHPAVEDLLGRYAADGEAMVLAWRGGRLVATGVSTPGAPEFADVELEPMGPDTFRFLDGPYCGEPMRAVRDRSGRIDGFHVCNRSYQRI
ncbi:MAG: beta-lactamase family protein [Actinomycetota bacterium]|nr:beta-lactamase family protein [Actinomycetota bacterium]